MEKNEMENIRDEVQKHLGNDYKVELVEVPKTGGDADRDFLPV